LKASIVCIKTGRPLSSINCFGTSESILEPEPPPTMIAKYFKSQYTKTISYQIKTKRVGNVDIFYGIIAN
jgi:hypothetical protein